MHRLASVQEGVFATPFFPSRISCNEGGLAVCEGNLEAWQSDAFTDKGSVDRLSRPGIAQAANAAEVPLKTRKGLLDDLDS